MKKIVALLFYPLFNLLWMQCREKQILHEDAYNWCKWKKINYSKRNVCLLFISDKAFRNLFYYRIGRLHKILSWLFPGYDHLQITTPRKNIGGGLIIQHGFATIISAECIGKNCKIYQQVTIGYNHQLEAPILGDNVEVCCGAKIIGGVHIGNNVLIGANSVVINDIPSNCVVAGVPAKVIRHLTSDQDIFNRVKNNSKELN